MIWSSQLLFSRSCVGPTLLSHENLTSRPQEFPRINERFTRLHNRYGHTLPTVDRAHSFALDPERLRERNFGNNLMTYDLQTGEKQTH